MKKIVALILTVSLLPACAHLRESDRVDPRIQGSWAGQACFLDRHLHREYGGFPVALEIHPDNSVTGSVGAATLSGGVVTSRRDDYLIRARLEGPVFSAGSLPGEEKDCVVFILEPPQSADTKGNIHLKTNYAFDFHMRVGGLALSRQSRAAATASTR